MNPATLAGRYVLVVGAGQQSYGQEDPPVGIGRALALLCARQGAAVAVADVDPAAAEATAQLIRNQGARAEAVAFDASEEAEIADGVQQAATARGGLDGLAMNTGVAGGCGGLSTRPARTGTASVPSTSADTSWLATARATADASRRINRSDLLDRGDKAHHLRHPAYGASKAALDDVCRYGGK